MEDLQPGDLVFFRGRSSKVVGHVGMVVEADSDSKNFRFIHASTSRGVVIDEFEKQSYYMNRYVGARRML